MDNKGGILGKQTLQEILNKKDLVIERNNKTLTYVNLQELDLIDETSINVNIGKLYKLDPELSTLDIKGKYAIGESFQEMLPESDGGIMIPPEENLVGVTYEKIKTPDNIVGTISERRTAVGNLGIEIDGHIPPGLAIDHVTFRLKNITKRGIKVYVEDTPPMKITFQSLSSNEIYGSDRQAMVGNAMSMFSGLGIGSNTIGKISYSFLFDAIAIQGKKHILRLMIHNESTIPITKVTVIPALTTDDYTFSSLSNNWKFEQNCASGCPTCGVTGKINDCRHKIYYESSIKTNDKVEFVFKIIFNEAIKSSKLKFDIKCEPDSDNIQIVDKSESLALQVQGRRSYLWHEFGDRLFDALLIAFLIFLFDYAIKSIVESWKIYVAV